MHRWAILLLCMSACESEPLKLAGAAAVDSGLVATDSGMQGATDRDGDGVPAPDDCDDTDSAIQPGADEICNGRDDDCDGDVDEGVEQTFYTDSDGDGFGTTSLAVVSCEAPPGTVPADGDCDDTDNTIHPSAVDTCNLVDDDCDGLVDEDGEDTLYADVDGDGYGDITTVATGCPEPGWVTVAGDCDDEDSRVSPGQPTDFCDGKDTDCDGDVDEDSKAGWSLLSVDTSAGNVYDIDPATAASTVVTPVSTSVGINSMDVSENGMSIVHLHTGNRLALFDACTATWTDIGEHGAGGIGGIGFGPGGRLFGIGSGDILVEFDVTTGVASTVGPLGIDIGTSGLAWDCSTQTMYGADGSGDRVFEIDITTGAATNIRSTSVPFGSVGLEFDRATGRLFASTGSELYTVDPTTGASTYVGALAGTNIDDLAWHPTCP